jgi:hypothetical protein
VFIGHCQLAESVPIFGLQGQKSAARSQLRLAIEDALDAGLPKSYAPELYKEKCSAVFEHVYDSYPKWDAAHPREP